MQAQGTGQDLGHPSRSGPAHPAAEHPLEYPSIEDLLSDRREQCVNVECGGATCRRALEAVRSAYGNRRCAFYLASDKGFDRETVRSYLTFFSRIAGFSTSARDAMAHFGLADQARTPICKLVPEQRALLNLARLSLFEPEVCFCERPLAELGPEARETALSWIGQAVEGGCVFVTVGQPLREALLMPGEAFWEEDGRLFLAQTDPADGEEDPSFAGDEVRVCKIPAKAGDATLLFDPRDIDFAETMERTCHLSVRGQLYPTPLSMDELEERLGRFGFFRCHRCYIVNVQKVVKVERYTRNSFNLTLGDVAHSTVPLAKGRAEEMRTRYGWQ